MGWHLYGRTDGHAAMIDRLVHHGHLIMFDGKSYRITHALMRQTVPQNDEIVS